MPADWSGAQQAVWEQLPYAASDDLAAAEVSGAARRLPATSSARPQGIAADEFAVACVAAALRSGALLRGAATGSTPRVTLDAAHVADLVRAERFAAVDGRSAGGGFAPLSRFWRTSDGWLRTHANYPWHTEALLRATGADDDPDAVGVALAAAPAREWEERLGAEGGVGAAVRTRQEWLAAGSPGPLVTSARTGEAAPRDPGRRLRVLDLTRVLAGPAATRLLGGLGADVLRIDPPQRPELDFQQVDGLIGKRSVRLDLIAGAGRVRFEELLAAADVLVYGYRPHASVLPELTELSDRHPGLVTVQLSAWDPAGPWAGRRGFDSIVQAACGIADLLRAPDGTPGALPCQLLDHGTGYLLAASTLLAVREQARRGGSYALQLSLARTAEALLDQPLLQLAPAGSSTDWTTWLRAADGRAVTTVAAPGAYDGEALCWPEPVSSYGGDEPRWR